MRRGDFGKRLALLRERSGLSQSGLARAISTTQSAISQIEAGSRNPTLRMLTKIGSALHVSPGFLIDREVEHLTPDEERLFLQYRALTKQQRSNLDAYIQFLMSQ